MNLDMKRFQITDRMLVRAAAVLIVLSAICNICVFLYWTMPYIMYEPNKTDIIESFLLNNLKELAWIVFGVLFYHFGSKMKFNRAIGTLSWILAFRLLHLYQIAVTTDVMAYVMEVTSMLLAFGLVLFGFLLWTGRLKFAKAMGFIAVFYVVYEVLNYRMYIIDLFNGMASMEGLYIYILPYIPYTVLMLLFTYMLFRPDIMPRSLINCMTDSADSVIDTGYSDTDSYLVREDLLAICGMMGGEDTTDAPVQEERTFDIIGPQRRRMMTVRRWRGESFLRATIGSNSGSFDGFRFEIRQIVPDTGNLSDCGYIRIYGETGMYADIMIREREMTVQDMSEEEYMIECGRMEPRVRRSKMN